MAALSTESTGQPANIEPGFHAIHANHLEDLRRAVVYICRHNPMPPLQSETFLVQSNGIAQWLKLALAEKRTDDGMEGGLGIAAGMDFLFPARFIWQAYRAVLPDGEVPEQSPFDKRRLVWRLYRLLPRLVGQDEAFTPLARFLEGHDPDLRNFQLAEKVADLFDQYQVFRADWLAAWEQGKDVIITARAEEKPLDAETRWQPLLWRRLVEDVGAEAHTSRSQIHTRFMEQGQRLPTPANPSRLPTRIVVFGVSSLPRQALEALYVLSRFSEVVLCVHNPCQFYWADIISDRELLTAERKRGKPIPRYHPLKIQTSCTSTPIRCWPPGASRAATTSGCWTSSTTRRNTGAASRPRTRKSISSRTMATRTHRACCTSCRTISTI